MEPASSASIKADRPRLSEHQSRRSDTKEHGWRPQHVHKDIFEVVGSRVGCHLRPIEAPETSDTTTQRKSYLDL